MSEHDVDISDVLLEELFILNHSPFACKEELFSYMAERFEEKGVISDRNAFVKSLEHRETLGSTYMGDFIAIPHGRCEEVLKPGVGFIRCKESFQYDSAGESGPVKYIFVLAVSSRQESDQHLRILATLAGYLMKDEFRCLIREVKNYSEMIDGIKQVEFNQ